MKPAIEIWSRIDSRKRALPYDHRMDEFHRNVLGIRRVRAASDRKERPPDSNRSAISRHWTVSRIASS